MSIRLPLAKFTAVLALVAVPAVGVAAAVTAGSQGPSGSRTTISSVADGPVAGDQQGAAATPTPSPSQSKDTTGWD
ncbi:hypothetical protein ACODT5_14520 [Streptomyces sp. 5.8]|uniref:hypothetical protein n=1 Tax=Streptomyces sp. 5.8 TaxID=3406571 RepID=UPI003BB715F0